MHTVTTSGGAFHHNEWSNTFNVGSVDLIAMVVSDAGLASTEPVWCNASALGCILLGSQPRGGWQVMQRAVQWGDDTLARCFGVQCPMAEVHAYFACSIRNRLETWKSAFVDSPTVARAGRAHQDSSTAAMTVEASDKEPEAAAEERDASRLPGPPVTKEAGEETGQKRAPTTTSTTPASYLRRLSTTTLSNTRTSRRGPAAKEQATEKPWNVMNRGVRGIFEVRRPTKLLDGARGGQAFLAEILRPGDGLSLSIEEQARRQMLSVILVVAGAAHVDDTQTFAEVMREDFGLEDQAGTVFKWFIRFLVLYNTLLAGFVISVMYALFECNIFGKGAPYALQLCSLAAWTSGATGLLMLGGNPRVKIISQSPALAFVQERLELLTGTFTKVGFGSLHGSHYRADRGHCYVPTSILRDVLCWKLELVRTWPWCAAMLWFGSFLLTSIALLIIGAKIATLGSQILAIVVLVTTSTLRGAGLSSPEEWMIPPWKRRDGAVNGASLVGMKRARTSAGMT